MFTKKLNPKIFLQTFLIMFFIFTCEYTSAFDFPSWDQGTSGYELAYANAKKNEKPLIVYFHIEGSIWNERMNDEYLASRIVDDYLMDIPKVEINGEGNNSEDTLVSEYKVKQFPAFFVLAPSFNNDHVRIHPFSETEMSVEEFLKRLKEVIAYPYNLKAFSYFEKKDYDNSLKYYKMATHYNPEDANTYYSMGTIYNYKYYDENKSIEILENARENYKKAIELNPDHEDSIKELEKLEKELERQAGM